jgi:anti-sigma regulatory factor (Ser/Thr protein kinase)
VLKAGCWLICPASSFLRPAAHEGRPVTMSSFRDDLVLSGQHNDLSRVVEFVEQACAEAGVDPAAWFDLQLATEEACANVIEHAYQRRGGRMEIRFEVQGDDVSITIHDHGRAFDPKSVPAPNLAAPLEERPLGGLGLHLMNKLMDEVRFDFSPHEGNTLVMVKHGIVREQPKGA